MGKIETISTGIDLHLSQLITFLGELRNDQRELVQTLITPERLTEVDIVDFANRLTPEQRAIIRQALHTIDAPLLQRAVQ